MLVPSYTQSAYKKITIDIINAGTSNDNVKIIKLNKKYNNPRFFPRKFEKWPDEFEITLCNDELTIRRTDVSVGGWGEILIIDVEFDAEDTTNLITQQKIPRVIYQTFETNEVPIGMNNAIKSWLNKNTDYEHYFFNADDRINFIQKYFDKVVLDTYLRLLPGAFKADLWRCCVLYEKGGVYVDADMICLMSLNELIESDDEFLIGRDDPMSKRFLVNGFIASIPKHPFLKKQIDNIVDNVQNLKEKFYLNITGPELFGVSVNDVCNRNIYDDYEIGKQNLNGYEIKILLHDFTTRTFKYNDEPILLTEYPNKIIEMDNVGNPTFYSMCQKNMIYQSIPLQIYFTTYDKLGINSYMYDSFKTKNKYWKINHFNDEECTKFIRNNNNILLQELNVDVFSYYTKLINGGEKSDLWRYCIIYLNGGVYTDADTYCNVALDKWIKHHDLILGIEANLPLSEAKTFGMDKIGYIYNNNVISVCNWTFAAKAKHEFFKKLIIDIINNPINDNVLLNTGPARITKHTIEYFKEKNFEELTINDIVQDKSILFNINRFGANQSHSNAIKNYENELSIKNEDVYVIHKFEGTWRRIRNKKIKKFKSQFGISHNLSIVKVDNGYLGIARLDKDTSRTLFMKQIGDCRSLVEYHFNDNFEIVSETEKLIKGYGQIAKFEDYRIFTYKSKNYFSVSYIDTDFNTKVGILDSDYNFLGDILIDEYNIVGWMGKNKIWEKNWLFFESNNELYFIYSTTPEYKLYKCVDFDNLRFTKHIDIPWPLKENVPENEHYFTSHIGSTIKIATGGSSNPIYLEKYNVYLYFIHTKIYNERKYNHFAVILNQDLIPFKFVEEPILNAYVEESLMFLSSVVEKNDYLVFTGGVEDNQNFIWELSKEQIFHHIKI